MPRTVGSIPASQLAGSLGLGFGDEPEGDSPTKEAIKDGLQGSLQISFPEKQQEHGDAKEALSPKGASIDRFKTQGFHDSMDVHPSRSLSAFPYSWDRVELIFLATPLSFSEPLSMAGSDTGGQGPVWTVAMLDCNIVSPCGQSSVAMGLVLVPECLLYIAFGKTTCKSFCKLLLSSRFPIRPKFQKYTAEYYPASDTNAFHQNMRNFAQ